MRRLLKILWAKVRCNWHILTKWDGCELEARDDNGRIVLIAVVGKDFLSFDFTDFTATFDPTAFKAVYYQEKEIQ